MTSIIEQADAIVGIEKNVAALFRNALPVDTYRRGAYASWYAKNSQPDQWPTVAETLVSQAERIVRLHKPKGDGLPSMLVHCPNEKGHSYVRVTKLDHNGVQCPMSLEEQTATTAYIQRCLAPPVRRLLAMYDVVEEKPTCGRVNIPHVKVNAGMTQWHTEGDICWLVPRGER